ncbi:phosphotransferase [Spirosoma aureum]|uniref:phosphotransferase n=1 Tax=Spirosoma aureum TaxID=2692134 RepID=UPI001E2B6559|nr:phosphotransferase [Spirosoma aureum]
MLHLDAQKIDILQDYLRRRGWLDTEEIISSVEKPGEGNMNYTLRVTTPNRTLIVKQSRDYVEKYPTIPAPANRAVIEGRFYQKTQPIPMLASYMPQLLGADDENNILVLQDLGDSSDYTFLYQPGQLLNESDTLALTEYLSELHHQFSVEAPDPIFANHDMRALNHEHIFNYPFLEDNGFDLNTIQPGLQKLAMPYKQDAKLKMIVEQLGEIYLSESQLYRGGVAAPKTLLHGDYYPGSWLQTTVNQESSIKIIDPEFCFYGPPEFDLGVMIAHLMMAQQPLSTLNAILSDYEKPAGFDDTLRQQFTGVEIMRRLIGLAQLPLSLSLEQKQSLLTEARHMLQ